MDPKAICGLLAEPERLQVFSSIVMGASDVTTIAERCDLSLLATARVLGRLTDGGLVTTDRDGCLAASPDVFKQAVRRAHAAEPIERLDDDPRRNGVLLAFFRNERLRLMPTAAPKVQVVLEHIAQDFDAGSQYSEADVNAILKRRFDDHATLRRYLVDYGLLQRDHGRYWRTDPAKQTSP